MEDDLTWLILETKGRWPNGDNYMAKGKFDGLGLVLPIAGGVERFTQYRWFTKDEYLARKADLQNKPSWADAPEWANWLCQRDDGMWFWCIEEPRVSKDGWETRHEARAAYPSGDQVLEHVIGDWRDTLERRPADMPALVVTEREKSIEAMMGSVLAVMNRGLQRRLCEDLYDAGYRKQEDKA